MRCSIKFCSVFLRVRKVQHGWMLHQQKAMEDLMAENRAILEELAQL